MEKFLNKLKCGVVNVKTYNESDIVYIADWKTLTNGGGLKIRDLAPDESFRHIYLYSERIINPGDYFYSAIEDCILFAKNKKEAAKANSERECYNNTHFKIEASTDKDLTLPLIDGDFIDEYCWLDGKIKHIYIETNKEFEPINKKGFCLIDKDSIKSLTPGQIARNTTGYYPSINENPMFYSDLKYQAGYLDAIESLINKQSK